MKPGIHTGSIGVAGMASSATQHRLPISRSQTGIFRVLADEHAKIAQLLERIGAAGDRPWIRDELIRQVRNDLAAHAMAEERTVYAALRAHPEASLRMPLSTQEHREIEQMLEELARTTPESAVWETTFELLCEAVTQHMQEEELDVFPIARALLSSERCEELGQEFERIRQALREDLA